MKLNSEWIFSDKKSMINFLRVEGPIENYLTIKWT